MFAEEGVSLNTPAAIDALHFLSDLKFVHHVIPDWAYYDEANSLFFDEQAAMIINGDWSLVQYRDYFGERLGVAPLPETPVGWPASYTAGDSFFLPADLEDQEMQAVLAFINFTLEHENQLRMSETLYLLPGTLNAYEDPRIWEHPILSVSAAQYERGRPIPLGDEMNCAWDAMGIHLEFVFTGAVSPEGAAEAMQFETERCIDDL